MVVGEKELKNAMTKKIKKKKTIKIPASGGDTETNEQAKTP